MLAKSRWIERQRPKYESKWDITPEDALAKRRGTDCTMLDYLSAHLAGILGIERVDAASMRQGRGGWRGYDLPDGLRYAQPGDLPFYKWRDKSGKPKTNKLVDHTGILDRDEFGDPSLRHASSGADTVVTRPLQGILVTDLVAVRRLTIGDPKDGQKAKK